MGRETARRREKTAESTDSPAFPRLDPGRDTALSPTEHFGQGLDRRSADRVRQDPHPFEVHLHPVPVL